MVQAGESSCEADYPSRAGGGPGRGFWPPEGEEEPGAWPVGDVSLGPSCKTAEKVV